MIVNRSGKMVRKRKDNYGEIHDLQSLVSHYSVIITVDSYHSECMFY